MQTLSCTALPGQLRQKAREGEKAPRTKIFCAAPEPGHGDFLFLQAPPLPLSFFYVPVREFGWWLPPPPSAKASHRPGFSQPGARGLFRKLPYRVTVKTGSSRDRSSKKTILTRVEDQQARLFFLKTRKTTNIRRVLLTHPLSVCGKNKKTVQLKS